MTKQEAAIVSAYTGTLIGPWKDVKAFILSKKDEINQIYTQKYHKIRKINEKNLTSTTFRMDDEFRWALREVFAEDFDNIKVK